MVAFNIAHLNELTEIITDSQLDGRRVERLRPCRRV